ncbi:hypothetical protein DPMN_146283 [Dreissena polymorpha]|uniref:Uncharacterized protein n=1 Tax=Dreissena polymorpha TaxID=45954 RepID=A0A9D4J1U7_DREPO|nr:hypothetical protein DPMN_146283 [Dreissena polymorpha]
MVKRTTRPLEEAQIHTTYESLMERLEDTMKMGEQNIKYLNRMYEKVLEEIVDARRQINEQLDQRQQNTERKLRDLHSTLKKSLEFVTKYCVQSSSMMKGYNIKEIHKTSPERSFIMYRKCLDQTDYADLFFRDATKNEDIAFHLNTDLEKFLRSSTDFGLIASQETVSHYLSDPNKVVSIMEKSQYDARITTDKYVSYITGICKSSNGDLLIADGANNCVKLLNRAYTMIEQIQLPTSPMSMCNMSPNEMAVSVCNDDSVNEIHFLRVKKGRMEKINRLQLNHRCYGIAIHKGDLFVTSGTAVYQYTMTGRQVKTLYEDKSKCRYAGNVLYLVCFATYIKSFH